MAGMKADISDHPYGPSVARLIDEFNRLPGIGRKSAERLSNYILSCSAGDGFWSQALWHEENLPCLIIEKAGAISLFHKSVALVEQLTTIQHHHCDVDVG